MVDLMQAVNEATAPYTGFTYYANGNQYYNPTQTAQYVNDLNTKFNLNLTPEEIKIGIAGFGDSHRRQFGYDVSQSPNQQTWVNQNGTGNFTNLSDPLAIARESVANVLRTRGIPEAAIQSNFLTPLQSQSTASTADYQTLRDNLTASQRTAWESVNPSLGGMGFGTIIGDLLSNPVVLGIGGAALGASGLLSDLGSAAGVGEAASLGGADILTGGLGSAATGLEGYGLGTAASGGLGSAASQVGSNAMNLTDFFNNATPDFTNYTGQMSAADGLTSSLPGTALDLGTSGISSALAGDPSFLQSVTDYITKNPGSTVQTAAKALGITGSGTAGTTGTGNSWLDSLLKATSGTGGTGGFNLLGALLGGGLGALGGGSKQSGETTTTQTPWGPQQPYLLDAWAKAKAASEAGNPLQTQANSNYRSVLSGPTTNPMLGMDNPYLAKQIDNANSDVTRAMMPAMNQANKASGSFGNSGIADQYGKALTDAYSRNANDMRYKDYYAQQQLQKDAVGNTLGFTTGASQFNAAPAQDYAKTVQGNYGGNTTSPYFTNPTSNILGGATLGSQIGKLWG